MGYLWFSKLTIISLHNIHRKDLLMEAHTVLCAVQTESFYMMRRRFSTQMINCTEVKMLNFQYT